MKKSNVYIMFSALIAVLMVTGCQSPEPVIVVEPAPEPDPVVIVPGATATDAGTLIFSAEGQSIAAASDQVSLAKARVAAATVAKANLLETIKGALVSSSVNVGDLMFKSQEASTTVQGWLARTSVVVEDIVVEASRLPAPAPGDQIVTAVASLEISACDLDDLKEYVE